MPIDVLSTPDNVRVQGSLTVINDPNGNNGNVNIVGNVAASGSASVGSGLTVIGGLQYDGLVGGPASASTISQVLGGAASSITMTGSGRVIFLGPTATMSTAILTPTNSALATNTSFTNGMQVTLVNLNQTPASTITVPSVSGGPNAPAPTTISGGNAATFIYVTALGSWVHIF